MDRECGGFPARDGGMAIDTGCRNVSSLMVRICGGTIIGLMTIDTGIRGIRINTTNMAQVTINRGMCAGQGIVSIVNCECGRFPARDCSMAIRTGCRKMSSLMIRICSGSVIGLMTSIAVSGKPGKGTIRMATGAIDGMTLCQWEKGVVHIGGIP